MGFLQYAIKYLGSTYNHRVTPAVILDVFPFSLKVF